MQEEDRDDGIELAAVQRGIVQRTFDQLEIGKMLRVLARLTNRRWGKVDSGDVPDMRGEQNFGVGNPAAEAEYARIGARVGDGKNAANHGGSQRAYGRLGEVTLSESGVEFLMVGKLASVYVVGQPFSVTSPDGPSKLGA